MAAIMAANWPMWRTSSAEMFQTMFSTLGNAAGSISADW